jgi:hypothetical protein
MITVNTSYFQETANYFTKHGRYDDGDVGTYEYYEFWDRELERCDTGMKVGDMKITGDHYFYLNHWPIWLTKTIEDQLYGEILSNRRHGSREFTFPEFWDVDWDFFNEFELAVINGQHFLVLKPRGTGFSYKGSALAGKNFFTVPGSKSYLFADSKEFLLGDGLFNKWLDGRRHLNKLHPGFRKDDRIFLNQLGKPSDFKKDRTGMHFVASTDIDGIEHGYMSEVMGIAVDADPDKGRGKRGKLCLLEEIGAMRKAEAVHNILRSSVEEGDVTFGTILGFGTGGTQATVFGDMEKMFYSPKTYNIRAYPNKWDEGMHNTFCSFFTPAYKNIKFKDKVGNSDETTAKKFRDSQREMAAKSPDQNAIIQEKAEHPYTPQEAILRSSNVVLPSAEARDWYHKVIGNKLHQIGVPGKLMRTDEGVKFNPDLTLKPLYEFPHNVRDDLTGAVVQYYAPITIGGKIPPHLYIIALDPYAFDKSTDGSSIGAAYVYMQSNNIAPPGDRLVATYFARPKRLDDFNEILFMLSDYYNAKIGFENDRGNVIDYAKRFKKLDNLYEEFELAFDADLPKSGVNRGYGMHIGSGKENLRMHKGNKFLSDWLITPRGQDEHGNDRLNIHTIYCPATLKEIDLYRLDGGNFDRISALRILAYFQKELIYKEQKPDGEEKVRRIGVQEINFWSRKKFA